MSLWDFPGSARREGGLFRLPGRSTHFNALFFFQNWPESVSAAAENVTWKEDGSRMAPTGDLRGGAPGFDTG